MCGSGFLVWNSPSFQGHLQPAEGFQTVWPKSMLLAPKLCLGNHEKLHFWHGLQVLGWYVAWTLWCCVSWTWVFLGQDLGHPVTQGREWVNCSTEELWDALWSPLEVAYLASGSPVSTSWGIWLRLVTEVESETSPVLKRSLNWTLCSHRWEGMVAVRIWADECCRATSRELFKIVKAFFLHFSLLFLFYYSYNKWLRQSTTEFDPESLKNAGSGPIIFICRG